MHFVQRVASGAVYISLFLFYGAWFHINWLIGSSLKIFEASCSIRVCIKGEGML
jgi:hypothetical protein